MAGYGERQSGRLVGSLIESPKEHVVMLNLKVRIVRGKRRAAPFDHARMKIDPEIALGPDRLLLQLPSETEALRQAREEWHRFWMNNQPSVLSYER